MINFQEQIYSLVDFIELRFGVYLDTVMGLDANLDKFTRDQIKSSKKLKMSVEELDKTFLIRGSGPPSSNLEECKQREIHRMRQGEFKRNNSRGGVNYNFAIENCLSDIFNYWKGLKNNLGFKDRDDRDIFPVMKYMRALRNRTQHDLYPKRVVEEKNEIALSEALTSYKFPEFRLGETIMLTDGDIQALVFEARVQIKKILVPYINKLLALEDTINR